MIKQKIKSLLSALPVFREYFSMNDEIHKLNRKYGVISELTAKHYVDIDLDHLRSRYFKRQELIKTLKTTDKVREELPGSAEFEEAKLLMECKDKVSIIIINRNGVQKLRVLMDSFHERDFYENFEIILIDNASTDDSVSYMQSWEKEFDLKIIRNQTNTSFSAANNQGAEESSGQYLLFLNNDTEVTDGWLDELILAMKKTDNPGAIGAKLIYPYIPDGTINEGKSYRIQHTGISFSPLIWKDVFYYDPYNRDNGSPDDHLDEQLLERAGVTAAVVMIKKDVFEKAGGFDERYNYGYEDVDLCLKLIRAGYRNYYCPTCLVFHYESATQQKDNSEARETRWLQNAAVLKEKWEKYLSEKIFAGKLAGRTVYSEEKLNVVIVMNKAASDLYSQALPAALEKKGCSVHVIDPGKALKPYKLSPHTDILLSFLDFYDISKIRNANPYLRKIAWPGQNYENWCGKKFFRLFDLVISSDEKACQDIDIHSDHKSILIPNRDKNADELADAFLARLVRISEQ